MCLTSLPPPFACCTASCRREGPHPPPPRRPVAGFSLNSHPVSIRCYSMDFCPPGACPARRRGSLRPEIGISVAQYPRRRCRLPHNSFAPGLCDDSRCRRPRGHLTVFSSEASGEQVYLHTARRFPTACRPARAHRRCPQLARPRALGPLATSRRQRTGRDTTGARGTATCNRRRATTLAVGLSPTTSGARTTGGAAGRIAGALGISPRGRRICPAGSPRSASTRSVDTGRLAGRTAQPMAGKLGSNPAANAWLAATATSPRVVSRRSTRPRVHRGAGGR